MDEKKKSSFVIYKDWMTMVLNLPDADALDFIRAIFSHCLQMEYTASPVASALLQTALPRLDADIESYEDKCRVNREIALRGWQKRKANASEDDANACERITNAEQTQSERMRDNDNDYDYDNESDYDNDNDSVKKEDAIASKKEPKHKYGQYKNVLLSDSELAKLKDEFFYDWEERIERLSEYIESKGAKYKNHLATIRSWARKEKTGRSTEKKSMSSSEAQAQFLADWVREREAQ